MIGSNGVIAVILMIDMTALLLYNVSGMCVTGEPPTSHPPPACPPPSGGSWAQPATKCRPLTAEGSAEQEGRSVVVLGAGAGCQCGVRSGEQLHGADRRLHILQRFMMVFYWLQAPPAGNLGAVFRTVLETTRTLFVWLVRPPGRCLPTLPSGGLRPAPEP